MALVGLAGQSVPPVSSALAFRFAGNAPTIAYALSASAVNVASPSALEPSQTTEEATARPALIQYLYLLSRSRFRRGRGTLEPALVIHGAARSGGEPADGAREREHGTR
ncbi:hypothetical protein QF035_000821 [Streptomyces umbrinus]|uniref:Uncharacterized protein n=1 Tax=Streptomyces umbrinus TaxID=67370 RepID=A0ABU0SI47_9ACTN|nr:hypothetical protein [Streptomyces umbrinus]MDQ1023239.1 hypothetical protein [Streptomyces umbrinus]